MASLRPKQFFTDSLRTDRNLSKVPDNESIDEMTEKSPEGLA